jgi:hypothetical protein
MAVLPLANITYFNVVTGGTNSTMSLSGHY